jgi:CBS domain-containing protein
MKVRELMTQSVETCRPDDALNRAAQMMWDGDCGCVPVVDEAMRVVGMITDRDICMATYTRGLPLNAMSVRSAMSAAVHVCGADDPLRAAENTMRTQQLRRLPVLDVEARLVGVLSLSDLARAKALSSKEISETLSAICARRSERESSPTTRDAA